jgi:hypothetical protein
MNKILIELFEIGGRYNFEFSYKMGEGENTATVDLQGKKIEVFIGNPKDENLNELLKGVLNELKDFLFK